MIKNEPRRKVAIIDGDVIAYMACKPREPTWGYGFKKEKTETVSTEGKVTSVAALTKNYTAEEDEEYLQKCWDNFQEILMDIIGVTKANFILMAVKSPTNYRDLIYPPDYEQGTGYKGTRGKRPDLKNEHVPALRKMAVEAGLAIEATGREADDMLRIWREEAVACGDDYEIVSIDKDLKMIPGKHYLLHKGVRITITPEYALRFYYTQLMQGDPTDNIPGIPKVGPIKAEAALEPYSTEHEFQAVVIDMYQAYYGEQWREYLLANGKLLYLQKSSDDYFNIQGWARFG